MSRVGITFGSGITLGQGITIAVTGSPSPSPSPSPTPPSPPSPPPSGSGSGPFSLGNFGSTISGSTITGTGQNGTLVGTHTVGSTSHGTYIRLSGGGYIDMSGYNFQSSPFTVRMIASISATQTYWATLWGNENWTDDTGWLAFLTSNSSLTVASGGEGSEQFLTVSNLTTVRQYDFVFDGTNVTTYVNGTSIGSGAFADPSPASNDLYIGSRHMNSGSGSADTCNMDLYAFQVFGSALSGSTIAANYTTNQGTYGI